MGSRATHLDGGRRARECPGQVHEPAFLANHRVTPTQVGANDADLAVCEQGARHRSGGAVIVIPILGVIAIVALVVFLVMHRKQNAAKSSH